MRFTIRSLALTSAAALALVGLTVPAASAATATLHVNPSPAYGAKATTQTVTGTAYYAGDTIALNLTNGSTTTAPRVVTAAADGSWSYTFSAADVQSVPDGTVTVTAGESYCTFLGSPVGTLPCGVLQSQTTSQATGTFAKDLYVPPAPSLSTLGTNFTINNTNQNGVTATGMAEPNSTVTLQLAGITQTATANSSGLWSMFFGASGLADGTYTANLTEAEAGPAHNVGPAATRSITKDTVAAAKTATTPAAGSKVGPSTKVSFTFNQALALNSTIALRSSGGTAVSCAVSVSGSTVSCTPGAALSDGGYTADATVYDTNGNLSTSSISFSVDATAPKVTNLKSTNTTATVTRSTVTGNVSEAATITVTSADSAGAKASAALKVTGAANFSIPVDERTLRGGTITVTVKAVDAYGNTSISTTTHTRTVPVGTTISLSAPAWSVVGWRVTLRGSVHLVRAGPYGSVTLVHTALGARTGQILTTVRVASNGTYAFAYTPTTSGTYYAIYNAVSGAGAESPTYFSQLRYAISASSATGSAAVPAVIAGAAGSPPPGTVVAIYKLSGTTWIQLGTAKLDSTRHYRFSVRLPKGVTTIRVTIAGRGTFYANSVTFKATRT